MTLASRRRTVALLSPIAVVSLAGCFRSPDMTKLSCTTSTHCPDGYQCAVPAGNPAGICQKPVDASPSDLLAPIDVAPPVEHAPAIDIPVPTMDGLSTSDISAGRDTASSLDTAGHLDTANPLDSASPPDTASPLDTTPDFPTSPDLGPDQAPDVPAQPDTARDSVPGCPAGQGLCGGTTCVDITSPANCSTNGITCSSCVGTATPWCVSGTCVECRAGGSDCTDGRICSNGTCGCPAGTTDCGNDGCINVNGNDGKHCGSCTRVCASNQTCSSGSCQCTLGASVCGGCLGWDFESGTQYWVKDTNPVEGFSTSNGAGTPTTNTSIIAPGSTQSLQVPVNIDMDAIRNASVAVPICQSGGTTDLYNRTLSLKIFFSGATPFNVLTLLRAYAWSGTADTSCPLMWGTQMTTGSWLDATCQFSTSGVQTNHIAITILNAGDPWVGTMYLDNVMIQ